MKTLKGYNQQLMASLFKKESTYNAAVTVNSTNFCSLVGHSDFDPDFSDAIFNEKDVVTGTEYGTSQEIDAYGVKLALSWPRVTPNVLIGFMALAEGSITSTQDGGYAGYKHDIVECADSAATPSINIIGKKGGKQWLLKGNKGGDYTIKGEENKAVSFDVSLVGSGYRAANADSFANKVTESRIKMNPSKIYVAQDTDISIDGTLTQGTQNISATSPTDLSAAVRSFTFKRNFNLIEQRMGGAGYSSDIDFGRRSCEMTVSMLFADYIALYEAQTPLAVEIDCKQSAKIDAGGTLYYGFKLVIPRCMLKKAPMPKGGVSDTLTMDFELDIQSDGTNPVFKFQGYNAVAAYLAA